MTCVLCIGLLVALKLNQTQHKDQVKV